MDRFTARDTFDFVYVPWDRSSVTNMSYAFVNFVDSHVADVAAHRMTCGWSDLGAFSRRSTMWVLAAVNFRVQLDGKWLTPLGTAL